MTTLNAIIVNYRQAQLTIEALRSLALQMRPGSRTAVVVDNHSDDGSADVIRAAITTNGWAAWARVVESPVNGGFAAGNNAGFAAQQADFYLLLNSDARVTEGAIDALLESARIHDRAGLIGPRLQDPDGMPQVSCFRFRTPASELLRAAGTSLLDRLLPGFVVPMGVLEDARRVDWVSFACVLVRHTALRRTGPMDEQYFMYFEDIDYARRMRDAGWLVVHDPAARVVHLRGGSSSVKADIAEGRRVPKYFYASRTRYFARNFGGVAGVAAANLLWIAGRGIARLRGLIGRSPATPCENEARDNWTNWRRPSGAVAGGDG